MAVRVIKYGVCSNFSSDELASFCRRHGKGTGRCPVEESPFECPFVCRTNGGLVECSQIAAEDWNGIATKKVVDPDEELKRDITFNLARLAHVRRLHSECRESDHINRMSLEGEMMSIQERLDSLAEASPELYQRIASEA